MLADLAQVAHAGGRETAGDVQLLLIDGASPAREQVNDDQDAGDNFFGGDSLIDVAHALREGFRKEIMLVQAHVADLKRYAASGLKRGAPAGLPA